MDFWRLFGYAKTSFYHHDSPLSLPTKNTKTGEQPTNLLDLCKHVTPICRLNPLLFNGHLQTFWTAVKSQDIPIYYKRRLFSAEEPQFAGTFAVDFAVNPYEGTDESLPPRTTYYNDGEFEEIGSMDTKPMLVTLHGLSGGSHEIYLRHVLRPIVDAGWEACVVNSRGCAKSKITTGVLYNARATWDVRQVVKWLRRTFPNRPLFGIGYSLGANILVNYLGEEGESCMLNAAVICSNPWNLEAGNLALQRTWLGSEVYSKTMGTSMKKLFEDHVDAISKNPRVDIEKVRNITYLYEFDRELQGPTWGYPTEGAYYRDASSCDSLMAVRIPLFAIHAEDDPIAVKEAIPFREFQQSPFGVLCTTSLGGHLSWFENGGGRWFAKPASQFLIQFFENIDLDKLEKKPGEKAGNGIGLGGKALASFNPMRRKLQIDVEP
ncbi:hypothetical protein HO173_000225 [Letharia columbiana]|uniref:alcohol O-acetyltransferase n=1 Tax=Letharia columbiana TaxID=112416 RepID=A0A8H6G6X9_9LECA|nr:uncharacterized protein HO173_000225 [Letharia columbiana]KAF6241515.1 hypothetical protein HO173_000225 [Letharia columbiana]